MKSAHIPNLDLNLLKVFDALMEERSVTRAGERLGLTQSAVSHALNRLRSALDDELFLRTAEGMRPTTWAIDAGPKVARALGQLQRALAPSEFNPSESDRRFSLGMLPYLSTVMAPNLVKSFRQEAPLAELVLRHQERSVAEALDIGRLDVAVGSFGRAPDRFDRRHLFQERLVWVARQAHPLANQPLTLDTLAEEPHLTISTASGLSQTDGVAIEHSLERRTIWDDDGAYTAAMSRAGRNGSFGMTAPDSLTALAIAAKTDVMTLVPLRMAEMFRDTFCLTIFEPPYDVRPIDVMALWRKDHGAHPAVSWLVDLLAREANSL